MRDATFEEQRLDPMSDSDEEDVEGGGGEVAMAAVGIDEVSDCVNGRAKSHT